MDLKVKKLYEHSKLPTRGTPGSAGLDLYAAESVVIPPDSSESVGLGVAICIPKDHLGLLTLRSKIGFSMDSLCHVGIIDSDFTNELKIKIFCEDTDGIYIKEGDKIAQITIIPFLKMGIEEVEELEETTRTGGFGSTDLLVEDIL